MNNKNKITSPIVAYWYKRVNNLMLNKSVTIPEFGTVTNYKAAGGSYGSRRFKITGSQSKAAKNGGNFMISTIAKQLKQAFA